ncbi:MAG: hypothetical protein KDJ36_00800 [Hyphomicrobiaceae bacterium]|nr:hypothetical protein [Hyphomicrobiaceae bacterium]
MGFEGMRSDDTKPLKTSALPRCLAGMLVLTLPGCAGQLPPLQTSALAGLNVSVSAAPLDVYFRIAENAAQCWFGPEGRLASSHIFHAAASAPTTGKPIEIALHRRTADPKKPWGPRAYVIQLSGTSSTNIDFKNISLPQSEEAVVRNEALAWANGRSDCKRLPPPVVTAPPPSTKPATKKAKARKARRKKPVARRRHKHKTAATTATPKQ